jgi:hypothetical protein
VLMSMLVAAMLVVVVMLWIVVAVSVVVSLRFRRGRLSRPVRGE